MRMARKNRNGVVCGLMDGCLLLTKLHSHISAADRSHLLCTSPYWSVDYVDELLVLFFSESGERDISELEREKEGGKKGAKASNPAPE